MFTGKPCRLETDRDQKGQKTNSMGLHSYNIEVGRFLQANPHC